jgi:hypothetical protein
MAVLVGADGAAKIDLGDGLLYVANIFSWKVQLRREMLRRTTQADEAERRTGGLADWSGLFSFRLVFSDDISTAQSAWQMLNFALTNTDDNLKAGLELVLQSYQLAPESDTFDSVISGVIKLVGTVVIGDVSLDCTDPAEPIVCDASWSGDGALIPVRT